MKRLFLLISLVTLSVSAFAQFPLGGEINKIKAYFAENVPYASVLEFKTEDGSNAICFTKVKEVGDYTFYFDHNGLCDFYIVTYDRKDLKDVISRFDGKFCKLFSNKWESAEGSFGVTLVPSKTGENFFSVIYKPKPPMMLKANNSLASN
jgi:hypothetical protein